VLTLTKIAGWILAAIPRKFAELLSVILGDFIYFLPTKRRRTILSNFHHTFKEKPIAWQRRKARISCQRLVEMALFNLAIPHFSEGRLDKTLIATEEATELLNEYVNPAKPVVGVTIHNSMMEACSLLPRSLHIDNPEVGVLYRPLKQKKLNEYAIENRSRYGVTLIDRRKGLHKARNLVKNNNWMILIFDQSVGDSGFLTFFLNRAATTTGFHQVLAQAYDTPVLAFYGERTGFWEGNLHVEQITEGKKGEQVLLKTNQWLENKLMDDEAFCEDWMWIHDRWKGQTKLSQNLNLDYRKTLIEECKGFYHWDTLPRNNRIWFRMPNHLGDLVKWIPFIKAVRQSRQDAEITLLVNRQFTPLLEAFQVADRVLPIPKRSVYYFEKFLTFRHQFPDTYYQLTESYSADFEARLVNAPRRYGLVWPGTSRPLLTNSFEVDPGWDERKNHQVDLWKDFLGHFGLKDKINFSPMKVAPGSEVINPLRCLQTESHDAPYFGLICGAGNHPEKCWPVDYWVECVAALMDLYPDSNICLFGTSADLPVSRKITEQFEPGSIHDFTGSTTLMQFVMALKSCSVVISNDCGGLHLANALGVPTVGLYGVTNPVYTKPTFDGLVRIVQPLDCPKHGGTSSNQICLSQVIEAISDLVVQPEQAERETALVS
jgi:ADP-heptose:LPS heptosyltransferase